VHETLEFEGKPGYLKGDLLHYTIENFAEHETKAEKYSALAAQNCSMKASEAGARDVFATPWAFLQSFFIRAGFPGRTPRSFDSREWRRESVRLKFRTLGTLVAKSETINHDENSFCGLGREWRGGQSQALLTLRGLHERKVEVELVAARDSPWQCAAWNLNCRTCRGAPRLARLGGQSDPRIGGT